MKFDICIKSKEKIYKIFKLGYTSEGGFFVKDLINDAKEYLIIKMIIPPENVRKSRFYAVPMKDCKYWLVSKSPKVTHHVDGIVNISGTDIMSGFYKYFKGHKGIFSQSMDLKKRNNDGGPIFIFHTKNLISPLNKIKSSIIINDFEQIVDFYNKPRNNNDYSYNLEFFYLPKESIRMLNLSTGTIPFNHPNYGIIPLKYIPCPSISPGIIGIFTRISSKGNKKEDETLSFSLNGGAGATLKNGGFEHISIIYPFIENMVDKQKIKRLDFNWWNKFKVQLDLFLFRYFKKLIKL